MAGMAIAILLNKEGHVAPNGHPENAGRLWEIAEELEAALRMGHATPLDIRSHSTEPISRIHSPEHVRSLEQICRKGSGHLDMDTFFSEGSYNAAVSMVNASLSAVDLVSEEDCRRAFILGRPPGHHAEKDHAKGFCLFNNAAIAAQYALDHRHCRRVAVIDFDAHHGNGTQNAFYDRSDVLFVSLHRYPFYPGTGGPNETGTGAGAGYTMNIPLDAGSGDAKILEPFTSMVVPAVERFEPELLIVSAGFDAYHRDPLGGLCLTERAFYDMGATLRRTADLLCGGRVVSVLEGGYNVAGNRESISSYLDGMGYD